MNSIACKNDYKQVLGTFLEACKMFWEICPTTSLNKYEFSIFHQLTVFGRYRTLRWSSCSFLNQYVFGISITDGSGRFSATIIHPKFKRIIRFRFMIGKFYLIRTFKYTITSVPSAVATIELMQFNEASLRNFLMNECNSVSKNHQKLWVYCWVGGCKETYHAWLNSLIWFQNPPKLLM